MDTTLIEEAAQRTQVELDNNMTLVQLSFARGRGRALEIAKARMVDPVAAGLFEDAIELLVRPRPDVGLGLAALREAAEREPRAYGPTDHAIRSMMLTGLQDAVDAELATASTTPSRGP